jgi:hypothetical protein
MPNRTGPAPRKETVQSVAALIDGKDIAIPTANFALKTTQDLTDGEGSTNIAGGSFGPGKGHIVAKSAFYRLTSRKTCQGRTWAGSENHGAP